MSDQKKQRLWRIVLGWNAGALIVFLAAPYSLKLFAALGSSFGMIAHIIYALRRRSPDNSN